MCPLLAHEAKKKWEALTVASLPHKQLKFANLFYALWRNLCFTGWMWLAAMHSLLQTQVWVLHFETILLFRERLRNKKGTAWCLFRCFPIGEALSSCFPELSSHVIRWFTWWSWLLLASHLRHMARSDSLWYHLWGVRAGLKGLQSVSACVCYSDFIQGGATCIRQSSICRPRNQKVARTGTRTGLFSETQLSAW